MQTLAQRLFQTVDGLSQIACFFSWRGQPAQLDALQNALNSHWRAYPILQPDRAALEAAVRRWDFSENEWICRDLLIAAFPDTVGRWTVEELLKMDTMELLLETGEQGSQHRHSDDEIAAGHSRGTPPGNGGR